MIGTSIYLLFVKDDEDICELDSVFVVYNVCQVV